MANIDEYIKQIQQAQYGEEVRGSIVNALKKVNDDNNSYVAIKKEVVAAKDIVEEKAEIFDEKANAAKETLTALQASTQIANEAKSSLNNIISSAISTKKELEQAVLETGEVIARVDNAKSNLDKSITSAGKAELNLQRQIETSNQIKNQLDVSNNTAIELKKNLDVAINEANTAKVKLVEAINNAGNAALEKIETAQSVATRAVETAKVEAVKAITTAGTTETKKVTDEGAKQVQTVQSIGTQETEKVTAEGTKQVQAVQAAAQEIITDREQINTNKEGITQLKEDLAEINLETAINVSEKLDLYPNAAGILRPAVSNYDTYTAIEIPEDVKIKYTKVVVNQYVGKFSFSNKKEIKVGETLKTVLVPGKENKIVNGYIDIPEGYKYLFIATNTDTRGQVIEGDNYFFVKDNKKILKKIAKNTADIEENRKEIEGIKNRPKNKMLYLPEQYNLVVGDTFELFWKGVILANNYKNYNIKVSCEVGNAYAKKYMFTPRMKDVGTKTLKIELYNDAEKLIDTGTVKLIIKAQAKNPAAVKNVLCVGDSLLVNGVWAAESNRRIAKAGGKPAGDNLTNIKYIGTMQKDGIGYEANGGWAFSQYNAESKNPSFVWITTTHNKTGDDQHSVYKDANETEWKIETLEAGKLKMIRVKGSTNMAASGTLTWVQGGTNHESIAFSASEIAAGNPFWNEKTGKVDFAEYVKKVKADSIDYCYILLGWNSSTWDKERTVSEAKKFINNLLLAFPKCQIVLLGLEIPSLDGFGENYGCGWNWHEKSKYVHELDKWYAELAKNNENVTTINISGQFDTENNMQTNIRAVNARNEKTETYQTNGVHPDTSGYLQIADAVYRDLTHKLQM